MSNWTPLEVVMLMLVFSLCLTLLASSFAPMFTGKPPTDHQADLMSKGWLGVNYLVSMWVGAKIQERLDK